MRSVPLRPKTDFESLISKLGSLFVALPIAPFFLLFNGGYSILGMQWIADHTGAYGRLFWSVVSYSTINVPIAETAGLALAQPIFPWLFVIGISFLQIAMFIRQLNHNHSKPANDLVTTLLSLFDYATTAIGLIFAPFTTGLAYIVKLIWFPLAVLIALIITFGFETILALVFRAKPNVRSSNS